MSSPGEAFLRDFHDANPGATRSSLGWGRLPSGLSSYQHLAGCVPRTDAAIRVLDLGCGDGPLVEAVRERAPRCRYLGVDIAEGDLALARERHAGSDLEFRCERAQSLSLPAGSVDAVLSHMALMLMDDLGAVLAEAARVLVPGGTFAAVIGAGLRADEAFGAFVELYRELAAGVREVRLGDARAHDLGALRALLAASGFEAVEAVDEPLILDGEVEQVWSSLALTYDVAFLEPDSRRELERRFRDRARSLADGAGIVPFVLPIRRITARRAAA